MMYLWQRMAHNEADDRLKSDIILKRWAIMGFKTLQEFAVELAKVYEKRDNAEKVLFAEIARELHYGVATSESSQLAFYRSESYKTSRRIFFQAVRDAYPELPVERVYDIWVDCNESVAYCAQHLKGEIQREMDIRNFCVTYHHDEHKDLKDRSTCYLPLERFEEVEGA